MTTWIYRTFLLLMGVSFASAAQAAIISQTLAFGAATPGFSSTLTFNQFDTSLGTLSAIQIMVDLEVSGGELNVDNDGENPASGTVQFGATADISSLDVFLLPYAFQAQASTSDDFDLDPDDGDGGDLNNYDFTSPDGGTLLGGTANDSASGYINAAFWFEFEGLGTYDIELDAQQYINLGALGGVQTATTPVTASGSVTVIYAYVPEPSTFVLTGLGALGLVIAARRRRV